MPPTRAMFLALMVATTALVGCIGGDETPSAYTLSAAGGQASDGYAYDGTGIVDASAALEGSVDVEADTGTLNATFEAWNSTWTVRQDTFSGQEAFKEGGIALDLVEHGDTGVSTPEIPRIDGELVSYGSGTVLRDGAPYSSGGQEGMWSVHLMLSRDTVRGPNGLIAKADGSTPYDPSTPGDARIIESDSQAILKLVAPGGDDIARAPANVSETIAIQGTDSSGSVELPTSQHSSATVRVSTSGAQNVQAGDIQVRIVDTNGTALASGSGQVTPNQAFDETFALDDPTGPTTVELRGNGTYDVTVQGEVLYDDHPFVVLFWDEYTLEPR